MLHMERVAVLMTLGSGNSARMMRGVGRFARPARPWTFWFESDSDDMSSLRRWAPRGVLGWLTRPEQLRGLLTLACPIVSTSLRVRHERVVVVTPDNMMVGRLAARHLVQQGFRRLAFVGAMDLPASELRERGFAEELSSLGLEYERLITDDDGLRGLGSRSSFEQTEMLGSWLAAQQRPLGVFAWRDLLAFAVAEACVQTGLHVPAEVGIIGADNDPAFCELAHPPLSSVEVPFEEVGFAAAQALDRLMHGRSTAPETLVPPTKVVERASTEMVIIGDPVVRRALEFMRLHARDCLAVKQLAAVLGVSRRSLESRFRAALGRSPAEEIRRARLTLARQLLAEPRHTVAEVARQAGFPSPRRLTAALEQATGLRPSEYRRRALLRQLQAE